MKMNHRTLTAAERRAMEEMLLRPFSKFGLSKKGQEFLKELLTKSEFLMLSRRIQIARMLLGGATIARIQSVLHASPITIALVDRWLEGKFHHYRSVLPPMKRITVHRPYERMTFNALRRNYPGQFALLDVLLGDADTWEVK